MYRPKIKAYYIIMSSRLVVASICDTNFWTLDAPLLLLINLFIYSFLLAQINKFYFKGCPTRPSSQIFI